MNIEGLATRERSGRDSPLLLGDRAGAAALDGFTIHLHPLADLFQQRQRGFRKTAVGARAYVQQKVGVHRDSLRKSADELSGGLVVPILHTVAPSVVHRLAHLQREFVADHLSLGITGGVLPRKIPLEHLEILTLNRLDMVIVTNETGRIH